MVMQALLIYKEMLTPEVDGQEFHVEFYPRGRLVRILCGIFTPEGRLVRILCGIFTSEGCASKNDSRFLRRRVVRPKITCFEKSVHEA